MTSGVEYMGKDIRGWYVFDVSPTSDTKLREKTPTVFNITINGKFLQLVPQTQPMRVYANPKNGEADEWEIGGLRMAIVSPQR
jgi:hypothetical protein